MSTQTKLIISVITILSLSIIGLITFNIINRPNTPQIQNNINTQSSANITKVLSSITNSNQNPNPTQTTSSLSLSNSSTLNQEIQQPEPKPKPETSTPEIPIDRGSNPNPIQDIPNVTKLSTDKSIYWQYIKDYLACPTKFYQPLNGGYTYEGLGGEYRYLCIPQEEIDKCPYKSLIYGFEPLVGSTVLIGSVSDKSKYLKMEKNKYYCANFYEVDGSVSLPMDMYYQTYFPIGLDSKLPGYYVIPKSTLPNPIPQNSLGFMQDRVSFAAIPLESFSQEDQQYIANNFSIQ